MVYRKKPSTRAKRNFKKVASNMKKVRYTGRLPYSKPQYNKLQGGQRDFLKITMHRELFKSDFNTTTSDQSMYHDILFNPMRNVTAAPSNGMSNLFYHPDFARLTESLYRAYKVTCIVIKFSRPNIALAYNNTTPNQTQSTQLPTIQWGTKIMHSKLTYAPDATTNTVVSNVNLTPRINLTQPSSWREAVDDGAKQFHNCGYKRYCTRVWKPTNDFERRWRYTDNDDRELCRGGIHIRFEKDHPIDLTGVTGTGNNWNYDPETKLLDIQATVYMAYKDRQ